MRYCPFYSGIFPVGEAQGSVCGKCTFSYMVQIVVCRDIAELYDTDLCGYLAAAVPDRAVPRIGGDWLNRGRASLVRRGLSLDHFFNAGVLVLALEGIRKNKMEEIMLQLSQMADLMW